MQPAEFTIDIQSPVARKFYRDGHTYVSLDNHSQYSIVIRNNHHTRCDVEVHVDGQEVGQWVVHAHSSITLDRPAHVARKFTFVEETSTTAKRTGAVVGGSMNGVVSVVFKPAKMLPVYAEVAYVRRREEGLGASSRESSSMRAPSSMRASSSFRESSPVRQRVKSGVTVLGDDSNQRFGSERALTSSEIDWALTTEVSLRLVVNADKYIPLSPTYYPPSVKYPPRVDYPSWR